MPSRAAWGRASAQQPRNLAGRRAELAGQVVDRRTLRQRQPHEQSERWRVADQPDRHRLLQDLGQLIGAVENEIGDAPAVERFADRRARLDRVHEVDLPPRQKLAHQPYLGNRCAIEMADTAGPQRSEHPWLGIAFYGIENVAREAAGEAARRPGDGCRTQAKQRLAGRRSATSRIDGRQRRVRKLADEQNLAGLCHRTILQRQEATCRAGRWYSGRAE